MILRFNNLEELKAHIEEHGAPAYAAVADSDPTRWCFASTKRFAIFNLLGCRPMLAKTDEEVNGEQVWQVKGVDYLPQLATHIVGSYEEAKANLDMLVDDLLPMLPVSIFCAEGVPLLEFLEEFA